MTSIPHPHELEAGEERSYSLGLVAGGTTMEWLAGCAAWILAIIGLAGYIPRIMLGVGILCAAWAFLSEGGAMMGRFSRLLTRAESNLGAVSFSGGSTAEFFAGIAGIPLGIAVLMGVKMPWVAASCLVFYGGALAIGGLARSSVNFLAVSSRQVNNAALLTLAEEAVAISAGSRVLAGLATIALGILALLGRVPMTLTLLAVLVVGATLFLSGASISGKVMGIFGYREHRQ